MHVPNHLKFVRLKDKGRAIFAKKLIKSGEVIFQMKGHTADDANSSPESLQIDEDRFLDSKYYHADDYINHSCEPNSYWDFENLQVKALKYIKSITRIDAIRTEFFFKLKQRFSRLAKICIFILLLF